MTPLVLTVLGAVLVLWGYRVMDRNPSPSKGDGLLFAVVGFIVAAVGVILAFVT